MPNSERYFELLDHVGLDPQGNPAQAAEIGLGLQITNVRMVPDPGNPAKQIVVEESRPERVVVKPIPGTRMFKTGNPLIASALQDLGLLQEVDPPDTRTVDRARKTTQDAREKSGTHTEPGENDPTDNKTSEQGE
jgi:enoyl-CoA hydratase/carnithine racemase